jgi:hypothetical protein
MAQTATATLSYSCVRSSSGASREQCRRRWRHRPRRASCRRAA